MRLIFTFVLFIAQFANAQNFDALKPGMSFTEFRRANPGAQIKIPNSPATDKTNQAYEISNFTPAGRVVLIFLNEYALNHALISEFQQRLLLSATDSERSSARQSIAKFEKLAARPFTDQLLLSSIIWMPNTPMPLRKAFERYGQHTGDGINKVDGNVYIHWNNRILGYPTVDGKGIRYFEYSLTNPKSDQFKSFDK
jgi:hypothetical protein